MRVVPTGLQKLSLVSSCVLFYLVISIAQNCNNNTLSTITNLQENKIREREREREREKKNLFVCLCRNGYMYSTLNGSFPFIIFLLLFLFTFFILSLCFSQKFKVCSYLEIILFCLSFLG